MRLWDFMCCARFLIKKEIKTEEIAGTFVKFAKEKLKIFGLKEDGVDISYKSGYKCFYSGIYNGVYAATASDRTDKQIKIEAVFDIKKRTIVFSAFGPDSLKKINIELYNKFSDYIGDDCGIPATAEPLFVDNALAGRIEAISKKPDIQVPVVIISTDSESCLSIDPGSIQEDLLGVAHIIINRPLERTGWGTYNSIPQVALDGSVGVIYPRLKRIYTVVEGKSRILKSVDEILKNMEAWKKDEYDYETDSYTGVVFRSLRLPSKKNPQLDAGLESEARLLEKKIEMIKKDAEAALKQRDEAVELERAALEENGTFQEKIKQLETEKKELNNKISSLSAQNDLLMERTGPGGRVPVIYRGAEQDYYDGEIYETLCDVLKEAAEGKNNSLRRQVILDDIIRNNNYDGTIKKNRDMVKAACRDKKEGSDAMLRFLKSIGFVINVDRSKHYRLKWHDDNRFEITMASSPSDRRASNELASNIIHAIY